ncbi:MAG: hypothetical protein A3C70_03405 [Candidatus Zambryskibacteria bacterium RIFCSPHIGHO2_02_FULL_43_14]|uniref:Uncharacterized protein n=1 Tax=Candidatus Zambryskibacteria bacterium RIFCSPHIGHO2_02_FULL_43_14 TaxID=1802748 RepID=A0A1G2TFX4_9BACT|nr:MAG: hypothetical protein A3C70_03405 [Candidatus Zambryskibacteria bacterium RIFCSPHIGHO2_02_FULL_43_14]OHB03133.1 MAG: hypothetical protein A3B03_01690 [Candidatus Zambryskibacteria bacterium RIFCSPLOWO2_01_FULL_42_41]
MLVQLKSDEYLIIKDVRWCRLKGEVRKNWVYDGAVVEAPYTGVIRIVTGMFGVLESDIKEIVAI